MSAIAEVLIPLALDTPYSYAVPEGLALAEGDLVAVPLGTKERLGIVWQVREGSGANFKPVSGRIEAPGLPGPLRKLVDWLAWYTLAPKGSALGLALKIPSDTPEVARVGIRLAGPPPRARAPGQA